MAIFWSYPAKESPKGRYGLQPCGIPAEEL